MLYYPRRTLALPSFTLALTTLGRKSPDFPDYYRATREEEYAPSFRSPNAAFDYMKTIDHRAQESYEYSCSFLLPDIFEDDEFEISPAYEDFQELDNQAHAVTGSHKRRFTHVWNKLFSGLWRKRDSRTRKVQHASSARSAVEVDFGW